MTNTWDIKYAVILKTRDYTYVASRVSHINLEHDAYFVQAKLISTTSYF